MVLRSGVTAGDPVGRSWVTVRCPLENNPSAEAPNPIEEKNASINNSNCTNYSIKIDSSCVCNIRGGNSSDGSPNRLLADQCIVQDKNASKNNSNCSNYSVRIDASNVSNMREGNSSDGSSNIFAEECTNFPIDKEYGVPLCVQQSNQAKESKSSNLLSSEQSYQNKESKSSNLLSSESYQDKESKSLSSEEEYESYGNSSEDSFVSAHDATDGLCVSKCGGESRDQRRLRRRDKEKNRLCDRAIKQANKYRGKKCKTRGDALGLQMIDQSSCYVENVEETACFKASGEKIDLPYPILPQGPGFSLPEVCFQLKNSSENMCVKKKPEPDLTNLT